MPGQYKPGNPQEQEVSSSENYAKIGNTLDIEGEIYGQENLSIEVQVQGKINLGLNDVIRQKKAHDKAAP